MNPDIVNNGVTFLTAEEARARTNVAKVENQFSDFLKKLSEKAHIGYFSDVLYIESDLKETLKSYLLDRGFFVSSTSNNDDGSVAVFWKSPGVPKEEYAITAHSLFNEAVAALKENQLRLKGMIDAEILKGNDSLTVGYHMVAPETKKKLEDPTNKYTVTYDPTSKCYTIVW